MKIDAHHHLWDLEKVNYPWLMAKGERRFFGDPSKIQRNYLWREFSNDAMNHGFQGSVHIQVGANDPLEEAKWVDTINRQTKCWPIAQVAFADLTDKDLEHYLDELLKLKTVKGIRQIIGRAPEENSLSNINKLLSNPKFLKGLNIICERNLTFDLQLIPELMELISPILKKVPNLDIVLCHAGSPYNRTKMGLEDWSDRLKDLSNQSNIFCKLSGLGMFDHNWTKNTISPIVQTVLNQFGAERVMFGSNFPVDSITSSYNELISAYEEIFENYTAEDQAKVFGLTAKHFYSIN
jgi:predicted TIM-barrel fold metal-dependent hydrolase